MLERPQQRHLSRSRREPAVDRAAEALHAEQHVDRDDDDQREVEQRPADGDRGALDEGDDAVRVPADVALLDPPHDPVAARLDLERALLLACLEERPARTDDENA